MIGLGPLTSSTFTAPNNGICFIFNGRGPDVMKGRVTLGQSHINWLVSGCQSKLNDSCWVQEAGQRGSTVSG